MAGRRWTVEESFQAGKGLAGLDEHQVRRWTSWHRWTILAMLAHAFLAVMTAAARAETPSPQGLIALTANEIRQLFTRLVNHTQHGIQHLLHWSRWRTPPPSPRTRLPPPPSGRPTRLITNYGWSTRPWAQSVTVSNTRSVVPRTTQGAAFRILH
ncbi:hypothetical protein [Kribbella sindirgiensis]|uniref:hypothetical protein n=1 Tax=Kribbella sindirgiensis TaxID=1124744 RepID=UPI0013F3CDA9